MYNIILNHRVLKSLDKIPVAFLPNIKKAVNDLAKKPRIRRFKKSYQQYDCKSSDFHFCISLY